MTKNMQDKKQIIKEAARELFFRFGFTKTSLDDIARLCGIAKPTLYYYYSNKESIFNEIVQEEAMQFMDEVERQIPAELPADEKLAHFFRTIYQRLNHYSRELESVPEMLCDHYPHGRPIVEKINRLFYQKMEPILKAGKQEGIFHYQDEKIVLKSLTLMTDFLNLSWLRHSAKKERDQIIETVIEIILNGLKRR